MERERFARLINGSPWCMYRKSFVSSTGIGRLSKSLLSLDSTLSNPRPRRTTTLQYVCTTRKGPISAPLDFPDDLVLNHPCIQFKCRYYVR